MEGFIHLYHGDGKGKTTAAMGLALRAVMSGKKVVVVQFLKEGHSSEIVALREKFGVKVIAKKATNKFSWEMTDEDRAISRKIHDECLMECMSLDADVLILDEICSACSTGLIDIKKVEICLKNKPINLEIVLTGREPQEFMIEYADYITEMTKIRHPFDKGVNARKGIEF